MVAAAYGSLLSIIQVMDRVRQLHARGEILFDTTQLEILRERFASLLCFLEKTSLKKLSPEMEVLTEKISILAVEAEFILDEEIGNQFCGSDSGGVSISVLDEVINKIGSIEERLDQIQIEQIDSADLVPIDHSDDVIEKLAGSSDLVAATSSSTVLLVGFEDRVSWVIDKLTDDEASLQAIPIVGMGGIGKTTLARSVYDHPNIQRRFDRRMWCTISQKYDVKQILKDLLEDDKSNQETHEYGNRLHKKLHHRRYLIIMDDMWDVETWECLRMHLPDNQNGSRVIVTTRNSNVATSLGSDGKHCALALLDRNKSWDLLRKKIFGEKGCCPDELKEIGMDIAKSCNGLPLSLVTIGGLLLKSDMTKSYWEYVAKNVRRLASSTEGNHCLKVLSLSYHELPIHLKPCFLYFRFFYEDERIYVSELIIRWIAEGFIKPVASKTLEDIAYEYLKDLDDRNLILILKRSNLSGKIKQCGVHDLVRDSCIMESSKENFYSTPRFKSFSEFENYTCLICCRLKRKGEPRDWDTNWMDQASLCEECRIKFPFIDRSRVVNLLNLKCHTTLRVIDFRVHTPHNISPLTLHHLWNLQFLSLQLVPYLIRKVERKLFDQIWEMSQLRCINLLNFTFSEPTSSYSTTVLSELQKLYVSKLRLNNSLIERIPNLKTLKLFDSMDDDSIHLLESFSQLQSLSLRSYYPSSREHVIKLPCSLKKLSLKHAKIDWDEMMMAIGSLPNLQVLKLENISSTKKREWIVEEGGFPSLKALVFRKTNLLVWEVESDHFPVLEVLVIEDEKELEIPSYIGYIDTLNSIRVDLCSDGTCRSVVRLLEEQLEFGNQILQVFVDGLLLAYSS